MKKNLIMVMLVGALVSAVLTGCGGKEPEPQTTEAVEETVEVTEDAGVEEIEKIEGTQKLEEQATDDTTVEVTEEATEESETDIAVETDLPVAGIGSDEIPFEGQSDDIFGVIYSLEEVPFMVYNFADGTVIEADKELKTEEVDNGDGTYTYTISGTFTVEGLDISKAGTGYGTAFFDANTGYEIVNDTVVFDESLSATRTDTVTFTSSVTTEGKSDVVYAVTAFDGNMELVTTETGHFSEYKVPFMVCR